LKNSVVRRRENLPILILRGRNRTRGHLNGSTSRQDSILGAAASPFVSMMRNTAQYQEISGLEPSAEFFNSLGYKQT